MSDGKVVFDIEGNLSGINSALNNATNTISKQTAKWTVLGQTAMNGLVSAAKAGFDGIKALAKNAFEYNASMETYEVNFRTLLGSAEKAQAKMVELKEYAAHTPFAFADLADATQTLLAFQLSSEDASLALKHLGDISLGDANKLQSLTLAFGQVSSAGKLAGQDLLQMINAGFNPLNVIAEKTGAAYADLKAVMSGEKTSEDFQLRMEAARREVEELGTSASEGAIMLAQIGKDGMISADMVAAAMRIATSEGGAFYKALENASKTAKGQIATIQDSWDMLTGKMTGGMFDALSQEALPKIIGWLDELNAAFDENGFTGLKTAAERIFGEIGGMAKDAGAGLLAQLWAGLSGDATTKEDILQYFSSLGQEAAELFRAAYETITGQDATDENIGESAGNLLKAAGNTVKGTLRAGTAALNGITAIFADDAEKDAAQATFLASVEEAGATLGEAANDIAAAITGDENALDNALADFARHEEQRHQLAARLGITAAEAEQRGIEDASRYSQQHGYYEDPGILAQHQALKESTAAVIASQQELISMIGTLWAENAKWGLSESTLDNWLRVIQKGPSNDTPYVEYAQAVMDIWERRQGGSTEEVDVELSPDWKEDAESALQSELDGMNFHTEVDATIIPRLSPLDRLTLSLPDGWFGQSHASGGIFNAATRFLGMHTIGESGAEAILPLDVLWRKMGLIFDQTFAANLDGLQYSVMPQIPAATPVSYDEDKLAETVAAAVKEAISGLTVEMDKRTVGRIVAPEVSKDIANSVNGRKWTA